MHSAGCVAETTKSCAVDVVDPDLDEMQRIFEETSQAHTSLASKLAQHNGLRQFSADFTNRVAPLELRLMLPELESSIDLLLDTLGCLDVRLKKLSMPTSSPTHEVREAMRRQVHCICKEMTSTFDDQRSHLRKLAAASPLTSPCISPRLNKRLSAALRSPPHSPPRSPPRSPCPSTTAPSSWTQTSPARDLPSGEEMLPLELPPTEEEFELLEDNLGTAVVQFPTKREPFLSVFSILNVGPNPPAVKSLEADLVDGLVHERDKVFDCDHSSVWST